MEEDKVLLLRMFDNVRYNRCIVLVMTTCIVLVNIEHIRPGAVIIDVVTLVLVNIDTLILFS